MLVTPVFVGYKKLVTKVSLFFSFFLVLLPVNKYFWKSYLGLNQNRAHFLDQITFGVNRRCMISLIYKFQGVVFDHIGDVCIKYY